MNLTLSGTGTEILSGNNTALESVAINNDGTLIATSPSAFADGSSLSIGAGAGALAPIVGSAIAAAPATAVPEPGAFGLAASMLVTGLCVRRARRYKRFLHDRS